jgi:hypothetical protein
MIKPVSLFIFSIEKTSIKNSTKLLTPLNKTVPAKRSEPKAFGGSGAPMAFDAVKNRSF